MLEKLEVDFSLCGEGSRPGNRRIFAYTFCLLSLSDDTNKIKTLNIEKA